MKLTLQLVVAVLNAQANFHVNLLKFTLHKIYCTRWEARDDIPAAITLFPTQLELQW